MTKDLIGQTLRSRYRVDKFIESGGSAAVYKVWDLKRNVPLAMKVLHADLEDDPSVLKRFQREANALRNLAHPHIVPFYGMHQISTSNFLLEHFIDGPSLKDILRERQDKRLALKEILIYLKALCAALGYAHINGVIHCDIKPGNVLIDQSGNIYLTDFGIARHAESTTTSLGVAGTPAYMAPEQIRGEKVSPATDIYALGVITFELLAGRRPFRGTEANTERGGNTLNERIRYGHLHVPAPDPRSFDPAIPEKIAKIILVALSKKPEDRFRHVQDFFRELCQAAEINIADIPERVTLARKPIYDNLPVENTKTVARVPRSLPNLQDLSASLFDRRAVFLSALGIIGVIMMIGLFGGMTNRGTPGFGQATATFTSTVRPTRTSTPRPSLTPTKAITATPTQTPTPDFASTPWAQYACQDKSQITLRFGDRGRMLIDRVELLERPADPKAKDYKVIRLLKVKEHIRVLNGPQCMNGVTWWEVRTESGNTGWIREFDPSKGRLLKKIDG